MTSRDSLTNDGPDVGLVRRLLLDQAPHLAGLPVLRSRSQGSSNWVFRLGDSLAVRLPRSQIYVPDLQAEVQWLPLLGRRLGGAVPSVLVAGEPSPAFPYPWAVVSWLPGEPPRVLDDLQQAALAGSLGAFVAVLHGLDTASAPAGAAGRGYRCGAPVTAQIDSWLERAAVDLADMFDPSCVRETWRRVRRVPPASGRHSWVHTDLSTENVLVDPAGRLTGVIDFGGMGIGDRSVDLLYAWSLFDAPARAVLCSAAGADEATWLRARAWAFVGPGLLTIAGYRHFMPARVERLTTMVENIAAEVGVALR